MKHNRQLLRKLNNPLSSSPVVGVYDPNKATTFAADASSYGLGAILSQIQSDGSYRLVIYASWALTSTEEHYAQIESH